MRSRMNNNYIHCRLCLSWLRTGYVRLNKLILHRLDFSVFLSFFTCFFFFFSIFSFYLFYLIFSFFFFSFFHLDFFSFVYNEIIVNTIYYNVRDMKILAIFSLSASQIFRRKHVPSNYIHH